MGIGEFFVVLGKDLVRDYLKPYVGQVLEGGMRGWGMLLIGLAVGAGLIVFLGGTKWMAGSSQVPATACDMRIGRREFDILVEVLRQIKAGTGGPPDQFLEIVVEPGKKDSCLYAKDLQEVFRTVGWWPSPEIVDHREKLEDRDVWFYGLEEDKAAELLCAVLQAQIDPKVKCGVNKKGSQPIKAWGFYIKD